MLDPNKPFLISPPFGNYFQHQRAYSVLGSFTVNPRPGKWPAILKTLRPVSGGWRNKIGLKNPGLDNIPNTVNNQIVSLAPLEEIDWEIFKDWLYYNPVLAEINVSCPNVDEKTSIQYIRNVIYKLSSTPNVVSIASDLEEHGIKYVHLSNTLPSSQGGISGKQLKEVNLPLVEDVAKATNLTIIAGGGIYSLEDVESYKSAGATYFSLATAFFWPPKAYRIINENK